MGAFFLGLAAMLPAAPLVPVRTTEQGKVPALTDCRLLVIEGHPLVITEGKVWMQAAPATWRENAWQHDGRLAGVFGDGQQAFALLADKPGEPAQLVQQFVLAGDQLSTRSLPPLPVALNSIHGTIKGANLFVHGTDLAGHAQLFPFPWARRLPPGAPCRDARRAWSRRWWPSKRRSMPS